MAEIGRLAAVLFSTLALVAAPVDAQPWPAKPIRLVVPFTPGTGMDILARTISGPLSARVVQPVVIDNKPGASGNLGADLVAKASPDGYTLMVTANTFTMTPALYRNLPYDPVADFAPVGRVAIGTLALVANPALGVSAVAELIALAKREPGKLNYASPGNGTPQHLAMESFKQLTGLEIVHVPYSGSAGAVGDVVGGQVPLMMMPLHTVLPLVAAGRLKLLAVSGEQRSPQAPGYPTFREEGIANLDVDLWYAVLAPARTPRDVVAKLSQEIGAVLAQPDIQEALFKQGLTATPRGTPEELAGLIRSDLARWQNVVVQAKIAPN